MDYDYDFHNVAYLDVAETKYVHFLKKLPIVFATERLRRLHTKNCGISVIWTDVSEVTHACQGL